MVWTQREIVQVLLAIVFGVLIVVGMCTFWYDRRIKQFTYSKVLMCYGLTIATTWTIVNIREVYDIIRQQEFTLHNVIEHFYFMQILIIIITYVGTYVYTKPYYKFITTSKFFEMLDFYEPNLKVVVQQTLVIGMKSLVFPLFIEVALLLKQACDEPQSNLFRTLYYFIKVLQSGILPNCYFSTVVICGQFVKVFNKKLLAVMKEVNSLQMPKQMVLHKPFYRMQRFCDLADQLDVIAEKYVLVCKQAMVLMELTALPFMLALLSNLVTITARFFLQYHAIVEVLFNEAPFNGIHAFANFIHLFIAILDVTLPAIICNAALQEARKTSLILQRMNLVEADVRFRQTVEAFALSIRSTKFKIEPLGMFEISESLIHDVFATVTSMLLILIQTDLTIRFT